MIVDIIDRKENKNLLAECILTIPISLATMGNNKILTAKKCD